MQLKKAHLFVIILLLVNLIYFLTILFLKDILAATLFVFSLFFLLSLPFVFTPIRLTIYFSLLLPIAGIGFLPPAFREVFLYLLFATSGIFFFLSGALVSDKDFTHPLKPFLFIIFLSLLVSFFYALLREWTYPYLFKGTLWTIEFLLIIYFLPRYLNNSRQLKKVLSFFLLGLFLSTILFIPAAFRTTGKGLVSIAGIVYNLNAIGMFLAPLSIFTLTLIPQVSGGKRIFYSLLVCLLIIALVLTKSRGAWIGFLVGLFYLIIVTKSFRILPYLVIIAFAISIYGLKDIVAARTLQTNPYDPSLLMRLYLWQTTLRVIADNFFTGIGFNNFNILKYSYGFFRTFDPLKVFNTHNLFLEILVTFGLLGFIGFFGAIFATIRKMSILFKKKRETSYIALATANALIAILVHGLWDACLWFSPVFLLLGFLLGLGATLSVDRQPIPDSGEGATGL